MKRLSVILTIIFTVVVLSNCSSPAGSIDSSGNGNGGNSGPGYNSMWVQPNTFFYEAGNNFNREEDLTIFSVENGMVRVINPADAKITVSEISTFGNLQEVFTADSTPHPLTFPGIYRTEVVYNGKKAGYNFEVRGYLNPDGNGNGFIGIDWL